MPSEKVLKQKQTFVTELSEKLKKAKCGVLVDYKGINVADDTKLRKNLRENNVDYFVVKNSLLKRALQAAGITELEKFDSKLECTTALGLSENDLIIAPKLLYKQSEDSAKAKHPFTIKAGFIDGKAADASLIEQYAKLPSKEELVAKLLFLLQSPMQRLAIGISEVAKKQAEPQAA